MRKSYRDKEIREGGIYHVTQRAPGREMLFLERSDYVTFLSLTKKYAKDFSLDAFCFCLMPNHIHLLLKINKANLSEAMQSLFTAYAVRFNRKYQRKGHVFCGVYRAPLCRDEAHLIGASLYIHLNPQKAGMLAHAYDYQWSSVRIYTDNQKSTFIKSQPILEIIDANINKAKNIYNEMLRTSSDVTYENIAQNPNATTDFSKLILDKLIKVLEGRKIKKNFVAAEKSIDRLIEEFRDKKRITTPKNRKAIIYLIEQLRARGITMQDIAKSLKVTRITLYRAYKQGWAQM